ncbi:amino acid adenylation domain-containing protein [Anderseniella sp. Alg231-50]|uniref:amino acid adenylation domain-containing protein n=1 Tax=Anderseniella sp. Alg231-50 TaxID=1922226 RepID=UPI000D54DDBC
MNNLAQKHFNGVADTSDVEFTKLSDIDLYRRVSKGAGTAQIASDSDWQSQIDALAQSFPDMARTTLVLSVLGVYLCRTSEDQEATFKLVNGVLPAQAGIESIVQLGIEAREAFAGFASRVGVQQSISLVSAAAHNYYHRDSVSDLIVSMGSLPAVDVDADIHFHVHEDGQVDIRTAGYVEPEYADRVYSRLLTLAGDIARNPSGPLGLHEVMSPAERKTVINQWNETSINYGYDGGLVAMMEKAAERNPDHPAIIFKDQAVSFGEFNGRVNRLARQLVEAGVGKDDFVCICMERSIEMVVAIWATVKAGGAYVPLNTEDPRSRITEIIEDCQPKAVLTQPHLADCLPLDADATVIGDGAVDIAERNEDNLGFAPEPDALAYMIYTSGSTGKPKGVTVEHEAIHNRVVWMHEEYGLLPEDRVMQKTPYTFDVSVWEFFWSFAVGSTLVVAEPGGHVAMRYLYTLMDVHQVTYLHFVPSILRLFLMLPDLDKLPIKKLFCSGEALGFDSVETFYQKANAHAEVHNLYGPTEAAVDVSYYHCQRKSSDGMIPIGKPVSNTGLYVLDENGQPSPIGVPGELHIGGIQLARGYWAREELTAERFVTTELPDIRYKRLYKTGDLAYFRRDGEIVYMGRNDFQVKINGVRMELGEIETVIRSDEKTKDVVVVAEDINGNKNLIAYVVSSEPTADVAEALKALVAESRPSYYVPREIRFLGEMPLTVSGKINRKLLSEVPRL